MTVSIEFDGIERTAKRFAEGFGIDDAIEDGLDAAAALLLNNIRTRFLNETDPDGNRWPPSQAALSGTGRGRRGRGGGTLFDTGTLFHSIQLFESVKGRRVIGTDVEYAKQHQEGIGQVQRVFLGFSAEDVIAAEFVVTSRIERALNG